MQPKSLLLVDDEPIILESLSRELASDDLRITPVPSGEEAVVRIDNGHFDLVITDLLMPGIDGFQVLKAAKQRDSLTKVILLTGYGDMDTAIDALRLGADDFLQKPCDTDELSYRMSSCFEKQDLQRKVALYENFLPVCCYCNRIRDDHQGEHRLGSWYSMEEYFIQVKGVHVSHTCCPDCLDKQMRGVIPGDHATK